MLFRFGFMDPAGLTGVVKAWQALFELNAADLLIIDHAPTALLAARGTDIPCIQAGTGFFIPPAVAPLPPFRWWQKIPTTRLANSETVVLETINSIQKSNGLPLLNAVHEIFSRGERLFCTFAELDHYPGRESAEYLGPRFSLESGKITSWPDGEGKKIFCYLYSNHRHFEGVLAAMDSLPVRALVYAPRLSPDVAKRLASGRLRFINRPVNMEHARRCCDLAVCHGGHGTVSAMLLAGRPLLLLPSQMEQTMMAVQIMRQKLGLALTARPAQTDYTGMLKRLLGESRYFENAQAFAEKYHGFSPQANTTLIADHCEATVMSNPV